MPTEYHRIAAQSGTNDKSLELGFKFANVLGIWGTSQNMSKYSIPQTSLECSQTLPESFLTYDAIADHTRKLPGSSKHLPDCINSSPGLNYGLGGYDRSFKGKNIT